MSSTDQDVLDTHTYALVAGTGDSDNARFAVANKTLITNEQFVYHAQTYSVRVQTTDNRGAYYSQVLHIVVKDKNYAPTDIVVDTLWLYEDNEKNARISTMHATDVDSLDAHTFALVTGTGATDNKYFTITDTNQLHINHKANYVAQQAYTIRLKTTDKYNLSFEKNVVVKVLEKSGVTIPLPCTHYVSPNGDNKNDYFVIENVGVYHTFSLQIIDAFGHQVHYTENNYNNDWDGKYNGTPLATGTYYYIFKNDARTYTGNITIVN